MQVVKDHYTQQSHSAAAVPPTCALCVPVSIPHTPTFTTTHCPQCWTHRREKCLQLVSPSPRKPVISGVTPRPQKVTKMFWVTYWFDSRCLCPSVWKSAVQCFLFISYLCSYPTLKICLFKPAHWNKIIKPQITWSRMSHNKPETRNYIAQCSPVLLL